MHTPAQLPPNHFLQSLSIGDFELLRPHLKNVKLEHAAVLFDIGGVIERLYFPHDGVVSLVVGLASGDMIEAGMIGRDGVVGTPAALDGAISVNRAIVQLPGVGSSHRHPAHAGGGGGQQIAAHEAV